MERERILLIDDEESIIKIISKILQDNGYEVETAVTKNEALKKISERPFSIILSDFRLPDGTGIEILEYLREKDKVTPFIIITAYGSINGAVEAMQKGATHYIVKPIDSDNLLKIISFYLDKQKLSQSEDLPEFCGIIGRSKRMKDLFKEISIVSKSEATVLIEGESGTGKELIARAIHKLSKRSDSPFVAVNCSAIPTELFENELFGHEKGSFTGAVSSEIGKIELAGEGTLFLDEIGELQPMPQAKLLRVLQEKEFYRLGGKKLIPVKCRIIAATNRDLEQLVYEEKFREDLFYRINVIHLKVPPLRERKEDIPLLVRHFLNKFNRLNNKSILDISEEAMEILLNYEWKGNVRELENAIERAVVMCQHDVIKPEHLPPRILGKKEIKSERIPVSETNLYEIEKKVILKVLEEVNWNQTRAAEKLGISRKQLRTKMKNLGILNS
ncbi:MAG TPA: sigma-54-dependent Fis family transcriptional regulator [Persephonella sp.]|uniref:Acetoacetate metabolism regulatory protein AtoC (Ornithine/argininedecarboxylase inhibitor) (Ornithine decarboxylase antizyme) n=1 Tax=Persephonella marina (strain DSM 14350 / EX-H1) TaxID=123214 RepID=C0QSL0_PERMH|nr:MULTISPECIES: sigma-54 dependent transcriptional regulator [Persephonella]ACO03980.1 acetoacetate metabolism regulatory protein AtoC (Ornithine/argininedecarboxylase inhibitor) (Ornithine decarboxylase antizyme) [Persephonella marina EX-H1]HCB69402.1 sigma-54-dependent Fis family transcriptional regulator [Persephonella sp.]